MTIPPIAPCAWPWPPPGPSARPRPRTPRRPEAPPPRPATVGFAEARTGEIPAGAAELITPETQRAIEAGLGWLAKQQNADGSYGTGAVPRQRGRHQPRGPGDDGLRLQPRPRPLRRPDRQGLAVRDGQHQRLRVHQRAQRRHPRPDVRPRLRHAVPGRGLRDDPSARDPREAGEGRPPHHRHPERRGRLALPAGALRRRPFGHHLPDQRACGPRGTPASSSPRRPSTPASATSSSRQNPDGGFQLHALRRRQRTSRGRRRAWWRCTRRRCTTPRRSTPASPT